MIRMDHALVGEISSSLGREDDHVDEAGLDEFGVSDRRDLSDVSRVH